jgi:glycosyltransferase involved in cell wall biosynthesis
MLIGLIKLLKLNKRYHFNVILAQDGVFTGFYSAVVGKLTGTKVIIMDYGATTNFLSDEYWNFQNVVTSRSRRTLIRLHTFLLRKTAFIIIKITAKIVNRIAVLGYELTKIYNQLNVPNSKIRTIQYSVDEKFYSPLPYEYIIARRQELGITSDSIVVNVTCRLSQEKGIEYLLPALKQAIEKNSKIVCLVIGMGSMYSSASTFITEHNLGNRIQLMGDATPIRVRDLLQISDIFIYSGVTGSNISLAVLEAMAAKCAIVATNSPRSHEGLLANNRGIIVPIRNSAAIAKATILLAEDNSLRKLMGNNARRWVIGHHSLKALNESITSLVVS